MAKCILFVVLAVLGCLGTQVSEAQPMQDTIPHTVVHEVLHNTESLRALSFEAGPMKFVPFIAPSYTPEMKFLLTAGGLITFTFDRKDPGLLRSSIPFSYGKSTNGSTQLSIKANLYFRDDKFRLTGEICTRICRITTTVWAMTLGDVHLGRTAPVPITATGGGSMASSCGSSSRGTSSVAFMISIPPRRAS